MKVFLGGTCNNSDWRENLISMLRCDYFNPVVDDWNKKARKREKKEKQNADFRLYVITSDMTGVYSIAEAVDDSNKHPNETIFCVLTDGFDKGELMSLEQVAKLISANGAKVAWDLADIANYIHITMRYRGGGE